ncbi:MAG: glycoside hydrolase family 16 protein, partial [Candidatus Omnitrophica bacterium]|nr:glycoside hydrolase family 16 protein [Candidatus Omnitrophota bacterium]
MRKNQWILMGLFILIAGCVTGRAEPGKNLDKPGWHLVWQDEFNGNAMDPAKWRAEDAALVKNNELQYYSPDEVYVHDGLLTLRSREREKGGRDYTSGLVETKGRFSQKFGRIEIRARLPKGQGIWPAHWMLPISGKWPPEIDIMELIGHSPRTVFMTVHWGQWPAVQHYGKMYTGPDFSAGFHTFAVEWDPDRLRWYVDGVLRCTTSGHIPQERFYIILNTAVGGNWPGAPNSTTVFPQ